MRDLIRPDASFTPRELFTRMQGAWFEPRQGYMWQENTGVTPTTSGGQTIGKLADLSGRGYDAVQATADNRPTLQYSGTLPLIRHDSTDVLAAAMPDLGGGVFSSAGSVYFATPQGMSALHNQSIGTSYNLPALQTDIYGVVITPARLAPPLEQRLAVYMHRLAGLADADFFWQEDYGSELVTNGDFSNGTTGWSTNSGVVDSESVTVVNGELKIKSRITLGGLYATIRQLSVTIGKAYYVTVTGRQGTYTGSVQFGVLPLSKNGEIPTDTTFTTTTNTIKAFVFLATENTHIIVIRYPTTTANVTSYFDNISVRELKDGQVGQLLADDNDTILLRA